jgi:hypothetical protein
MKCKAQTFTSGLMHATVTWRHLLNLIKEDHFACATRMFEILAADS